MWHTCIYITPLYLQYCKHPVASGEFLLLKVIFEEGYTNLSLVNNFPNISTSSQYQITFLIFTGAN